MVIGLGEAGVKLRSTDRGRPVELVEGPDGSVLCDLYPPVGSRGSAWRVGMLLGPTKPPCGDVRVVAFVTSSRSMGSLLRVDVDAPKTSTALLGMCVDQRSALPGGGYPLGSKTWPGVLCAPARVIGNHPPRIRHQNRWALPQGRVRGTSYVDGPGKRTRISLPSRGFRRTRRTQYPSV